MVFALLTLMCHGELYAHRPSPRRLTEFYLCTSLGGVIGGAFAGLLAPQIFNGNYEYPILIALALLCMPGIFAGGVRKALAEASPWLLLSAALALVWYVTRLQAPATLELPFQVLLALMAAVMLFQRQRPMRFFALVVLSFVDHGAVAARHRADRDRAQLLRRASGGRGRRRQGPHALSRHHDPRRATVAQRGRHAR